MPWEDAGDEDIDARCLNLLDQRGLHRVSGEPGSHPICKAGILVVRDLYAFGVS